MKSVMNLGNVDTVKGKITDWLREEGFQFKEVDDSNAYFNLITMVGGKPYHIFQNRGKMDSVTVASNLELTPGQIKLFSQIAKAEKQLFLCNLRIALLTRQSLGDFKIKPKPPEQIEQIFLSSKPIYYDELRKGSLISTLYDTHKSAMMAIWLLEEVIGTPSTAASLQSMYT